jgi:succinate-semialdehyde dehydrogenase/glutarate-semialdehyde dehydrogenase
MQGTNVMVSVNPATGERVAEYAPHSPAEASELLNRCREAFRAWSHRPLDERLPVLARAGALLRKRRDELARLATLEMGKTIAAAEAEVEKCAWVCEYYAQHASLMLGV